MNWALVYNVLMEECGADPNLNAHFCFEMSDGCREYRFMGSLGMGGKLYSNNGGIHVACYPEDETAERIVAIARANTRLSELSAASDSKGGAA